MKILTLCLISLLAFGCGRSSNKKQTEKDVRLTSPALTIDSLVSEFQYPNNNQLEYSGVLLADLSSSLELVTLYGSVLKGRTLNLLTIEGKEFLVYGEDGVFASECEPNEDYPDHGPSHPLCQVAHGESFDKVIICISTNQNTSLMTAQNWPGYPTAIIDANLGMSCWVNGVKMLSERIFTY